MIEAQQFVMWILRKVFKLPRRWYNQLLTCYEYNDWPIPILLTIIGVALLGVASGIATSAFTGNGKVAGAVCLTVWIIGGGFVVTTGVHALYLVFKQEQQELIERLKQ